MGYFYLALAILAEVLGTSALKASEAFTKPLPSMGVVVGYGVAFYCLSLVLKTIPVGMAYAIWSGMGIVLITIVGAVIFHQKVDAPAIIGMALIICGVAIMNIFSRSVAH